jgi:DNA-binding transcriptional MerR regulator
MTTHLSIGQLARLIHESVRTLRYWTDHGLLEATRAENGYRYYASDAPSHVKFIRQAQSLGLSLANIVALLRANHSSAICHDVQGTLRTRLEEVRSELETLHRLEAKLEEVLESSIREPCEEGSCRFLP